jgi:hypothetical protein
MKANIVHGTAFGVFNPVWVCERVDNGYIKFHDSEIYSEIPLKMLRVRLSESRQYLVRNAIRVEIACRQVESFRLDGSM